MVLTKAEIIPPELFVSPQSQWQWQLFVARIGVLLISDGIAGAAAVAVQKKGVAERICSGHLTTGARNPYHNLETGWQVNSNLEDFQFGLFRP